MPRIFARICPKSPPSAACARVERLVRVMTTHAMTQVVKDFCIEKKLEVLVIGYFEDRECVIIFEVTKCSILSIDPELIVSLFFRLSDFEIYEIGISRDE
jgi:hypothetical protein